MNLFDLLGMRFELNSPLTWFFLSEPSLSPEWAPLSPGIAPPDLSHLDWRVRPTLRIFLLIFRLKNIWPAGKNIYIRQLLHNQREWSVSSVGQCRASLCICDGQRWQWVQCWSKLRTLGDTGGTMPADTCWVLTRDNWLTRSYFLSSWQFALTWSEHSN